MRKHIIVESYEQEDGEKYYIIDVLKDGYNIIDFTIYDDELGKNILEAIEKAEEERRN